jgi:hypothetical protein
MILAFTRDRDIEKTKKYLDDRVSRVKSAADGSISGYSKVASDYIDAMIALYKQLSAAQADLPDIAADIEKRGSFLATRGKALDDMYQKYCGLVAQWPFGYYAWMKIYDVATALKNLGESVLSFAHEIKPRYELCVSIQNQLDQELQRISNELAKYEP